MYNHDIVLVHAGLDDGLQVLVLHVVWDVKLQTCSSLPLSEVVEGPHQRNIANCHRKFNLQVPAHCASDTL